ncbi:TIM barrel protein [Nocardia callitridis]|uniref:TIM barrel protein n=1 Tax=Nocardia callitridis TaxID=648753 RepID=A0ABP9KTJ4_9NOCA
MFSARRFAANCSMLFGDVPVLEQAARAAAAGYDMVEFWWPFERSVPDDAEVTRFVEAVGAAGPQVIAMNFTLGDAVAGERGIVSDPARIAEFREHLDVLAGIVARLGVLRCCVPYGRVPVGRRLSAHQETAIANLAVASDRLRTVGAVPMLEPLSGVADYPITTAEAAEDIAVRVDSALGRAGTVGILADLYHLAANGADIEAVLRRHIKRIVHVQVADFPGRHEPGTGRLDIDRYLAVLNELGYHGHFALEFVPSPGDRRST